MENATLSAGELLQSVFNKLTEKGKNIKLHKKAFAVIADDSDYHRTRIGYTGYKAATIIKIGDKHWAIAFGENAEIIQQNLTIATSLQFLSALNLLVMALRNYCITNSQAIAIFANH